MTATERRGADARSRGHASGSWQWRRNLLAVVLFIAYYVVLLVYYPALLIAGLVAWIRQRRAVLQKPA